VLVTGAGHGLGEAYAVSLAAACAKVVLNDANVSVRGIAENSVRAADEVVRKIRSNGGEAVAVYGDVSDPRCGEEALAAALDTFGRIDALVNNAGIVRDSSFAEMSRADFDRVLEVHLLGTMRMTQPVFRHMCETGGGVIVNTTSRSGLRGKAEQTNYSAAKAGIIGFSAALAIEGAEHGVRVLTISPRAATRAWSTVTTTSAGPMSPALAHRFAIEPVCQTLVWMVSDHSAPHTGKVVFASAEAIHDVRWESATPLEPWRGMSATDIANAAAQGGVVFAGPDDRDWI
jgi:NAD(P)-dependent dehydrogenase (short-subunit alcohol dehydrogenase family)